MNTFIKDSIDNFFKNSFIPGLWSRVTQLKKGSANTSWRKNIDRRNGNDDATHYSDVDDNSDDDIDFTCLIWEDDLPGGGIMVTIYRDDDNDFGDDDYYDDDDNLPGGGRRVRWKAGRVAAV